MLLAYQSCLARAGKKVNLQSDCFTLSNAKTASPTLQSFALPRTFNNLGAIWQQKGQRHRSAPTFDLSKNGQVLRLPIHR